MIRKKKYPNIYYDDADESKNLTLNAMNLDCFLACLIKENLVHQIEQGRNENVKIFWQFERSSMHLSEDQVDNTNIV